MRQTVAGVQLNRKEVIIMSIGFLKAIPWKHVGLYVTL